MENSIELFISLVIILICANLGGFIAVKLKQPSVLGQILAGLLIGPSVFHILEGNSFIHVFSEIGVLLLMFMAGLDTNIDDMKKSAGSSSLIAIGGVIIPYVFGFFTVMLFYEGATTSAAIYAGVILTATSISITIQSLKEFNKLKDRVGVNILGAAIIDDVLGIVVLAIVMGIVNPSKAQNPLIVIVNIFIFFVVAIVIGILMVYIFRRFIKISEINSPTVIAIIFMFLLSIIASKFGIAAIIGAYTAGLIFSSFKNVKKRIDKEVSIIAYSVFTPVFFANIGISVNLNGVSSIIAFGLLFLFAAIAGKMIGCGVGAKLTGFSNRESIQVSIGMIPRAEVALIVAELGKNYGIIPDGLFTTAIIVSVGTTILTPILLKIAFTDKKRSKAVI